MKDIAEGSGMTSLPPSLARKYPNAVKEFKWLYLFPSTMRCKHPYDGYCCRHHLHGSALAIALKLAVRKSGVTKHVTAHTIRHSSATQIYTHVIGQHSSGAISPFNELMCADDRPLF